MHKAINTEPDLEVKSTNVITRVWSLDKHMRLPVIFASPELCMVEFANGAKVWKIAQLNTQERYIELSLGSLKPVRVNAEFSDFEGKSRMPNIDEETAIEEMCDIVWEIARDYGQDGTLV